MVEKIDIEKMEHALDLAKEYTDEMFLDGNDQTVVLSVFGFGFGALAHIEKMSRETFLEGCSIIYDQMDFFAKEFPKNNRPIGTKKT
jgi:hypothetical protein